MKIAWNSEDYARNSTAQAGWALELLDGVPLRGDEDVLDIGCGDGKITAELAARVPRGSVVGIDYSDDMVRLAHERHGASARNLRFEPGDARKLESTEAFDLVFSSSVLHWIVDHGPVLRGIRRALYQAVKRGVTVVVVIAQTSDVRVAKMASKALYNELLAGGVRIFEYPLSMIHSKIAVIDDVWSMVGSYNLDHRSLLLNLEVGVLLIDKPFTAAMREQILKDIANSEEVTKESHAARSWNEALFESLAYQARYWL